MFSSMTVRLRLALGFGSVVALLLVISVTSMLRMATVHQASGVILDQLFPKVLFTEDIAKSALNVDRLVRSAMLAKSPADAEKKWSKLGDTQRAGDELMKRLEPALRLEKGKALFHSLAERRAALVPKIERIHELNNADKAKAVDYLNSDFLPASAAIIAASEELTQFQIGLMAAAKEEGGAVFAATRQLVLVLSSVAVLMALGISWLITRKLQQLLGGEPAVVAAVANHVATGDFSSRIALKAGDTRSLFASVARMQTSLQERADSDRQHLAEAAENLRIRIALDRVSVGVMLADNDGKIIYTNDFSSNIFRTRASEIRKGLPQFDPERIIGSSFDSFHRVPSHQRNMLADLTKTHIADIKMGDATLRVIANPVLDAGGKRLGTVVQWLDRTQEIAIEQEVQNTVAAAIDGNLTARIREDDKDGFFQTLASGVNRLVGNMADVLRTISGAAAEVGTGAEEISRGNTDLSQRTEQQASSLEETASSMEQMTSAVKNNADNAAQASQLARAARDQAERGGAVVRSAVTAMADINASSKKIADIIGVIDAIAFQTNLLALNAAVEAARAGDQGRGFAVVASEVRNLASRSATAAKEIKQLIQESVSKVDDGTKLVDASGKVLEDIVVGVKKVTDVVAEIASSSQEQASGIEQVNKAIMSMDEVTQQNAALVEEATAAAQSLSEQAASLTRLMARFQVGDETSATPSAEPSSAGRRAPPHALARRVANGG
jgi:methyl-accepting chemotaxis protein